jgi:mRNA interferase MazF
MKEGDIVLTPIPQADGGIKNRPALILRKMPPYNDLLLCGISTQLRQAVPDFDDVIAVADTDFAKSGLLADSVIRLGFLAVVPAKSIPGSIGSVSTQRYERLLTRLSAHLVKNIADQQTA